MCYNISNSTRIEIPKHQEQGKEAEKNQQIVKTKNSRREVTAYELRLNYKRREKTFPLRFFVLLEEINNEEMNYKRTTDLIYNIL